MREKIKNVILFIIVLPMYIAIPALFAYIVLRELNAIYWVGFAFAVIYFSYLFYLMIKSRNSK